VLLLLTVTEAVVPKPSAEATVPVLATWKYETDPPITQDRVALNVTVIVAAPLGGLSRDHNSTLTPPAKWLPKGESDAAPNLTLVAGALLVSETATMRITLLPDPTICDHVNELQCTQSPVANESKTIGVLAWTSGSKMKRNMNKTSSNPTPAVTCLMIRRFIAETGY
jgi:hypothetical protein